MPPRPDSNDVNAPALHRRMFLGWAGVAGMTLSTGCLEVPSSGSPDYESSEIDNGAIFGPGLQDDLDREYDAALVVTESEANVFDLDRLSDAETAFINTTDFSSSYLGVIQVSEIDASRRIEVVDIHQSNVNLTVVVAVRGDTSNADERVITTLLLRVERVEEGIPDTISVELDIGDDHETFSGSQV